MGLPGGKATAEGGGDYCCEKLLITNSDTRLGRRVSGPSDEGRRLHRNWRRGGFRRSRKGAYILLIYIRKEKPSIIRVDDRAAQNSC